MRPTPARIAAEPPAAPAPPPPEEFRVLVVDDEEDFRLALCVLLEEAGYMASGAASATEALVALEEFPADLALADLVMPDMDGVHLTARIRDISPQTVLVAITGATTADATVDAMRQGVGNFLAKPFGKADLLRAVGEALAPARLQRESDRWRRLAALLQAGQTLAGLAEAELAGEATKILLEHFGAEEAAVFAPMENGARPRPLARSGKNGAGDRPTLLAEAAEGAQETGALEIKKARRHGGTGQGYAMAAPLRAGDRLLGAVALARRSPRFAECEGEALLAFSQQLAAAMEIARRISELEALSQRPPPDRTCTQGGS